MGGIQQTVLKQRAEDLVSRNKAAYIHSVVRVA